MIAYGRFTYIFCSALSDLAFDLCGSHQLSLKEFEHICFSILLTHVCNGVRVSSVRVTWIGVLYTHIQLPVIWPPEFV